MTMTLSSIAALCVTMFVLSVVPGPSDVAVVARSLASGFRHGVIFTIGVVLADAVFILLAAFGLTALAVNATEWFSLVKYGGAAFLIYMGIGGIRARVTASDLSPKPASTHSSFASGFLITLGDPKAILFYFGFLPAFLDLKTATTIDYVVILVAATVVIGVVKLGYAWLGSRSTAFFNNVIARLRLNIVAGMLLIATGMFIVVKS
jgi:threonine/homoserine/homoserine lactone efflux protein